MPYGKRAQQTLAMIQESTEKILAVLGCKNQPMETRILTMVGK